MGVATERSLIACFWAHLGGDVLCHWPDMGAVLRFEPTPWPRARGRAYDSLLVARLLILDICARLGHCRQLTNGFETCRLLLPPLRRVSRGP